MEGFNSDEKWKGNEEYGPKCDTSKAWSIKFSDKDCCSLTIVSGDGTIQKTYDGEDFEKKKYEKDEFLNDIDLIERKGGVSIYV